MRLLRPTAVLTVLGLAAAGVVTLVPTATAATTTDTVKLASYLTSQLTDGKFYDRGDGTADVGLTVDGAFGLAATGRDNATVATIADYLDAHDAADYAEFGGKPANLASGAAAKVALFAEVAHRDPHDFAGLDLLRLLQDHICTARKVVQGRVVCDAKGNYYNAPSVFSQALGVIAQQRAGTADPTAVAYLLSLQNPDGSFPSLIPSGHDSDPDSTGMAVQALAILPAATAGGDVTTAIGAANAWLERTQNADGSWSPSFDTTAHSVNSTALALQALSIDSATIAAQGARIAKAQAFIAGVQNADGGVAAYAPPGQPGSDTRASTQALSGVVGVPFGTLSVSLPVTRTATTVPAAKAAAAYLVGRLTTGDHYENGGYVQQSTTGDVALGLLASGGQDAALAKVLAYLTLDTTLRSYISGANFGDASDSLYTGTAAKLATLLELAGKDPRDVGVNHVDLIGEVTALTSADGRIHNRSDFPGDANVLGQAFAVLALTGAGDTAAATKARAALTAAQCPDGGFPEKFDLATCTSSPDVTGLAVQALNAGHATSTKAVTAADAPTELVKALGWLTSNEKADGSYAGAPAVTNSTGYAALGLLAVGQNATKPKAFLTGIANRDGGLPTGATGGSDVLATAQALPALAGASLLQVAPSVLAPVNTIVGNDPPTTTPPTTTPPTPPTSTPPTTPGTGPGTGTTTPGPGQSGLGGGTNVGGGSLPDTGANVLGPLWIAVLALLVGAAATTYGVRRPRRGSHAARRH